MAWVLSFMVTFLPSSMNVLVCRLGFQTFLVWRCEKLTLLPYCLPLPLSSHICMVIPKLTKIQGVSIADNHLCVNEVNCYTNLMLSDLHLFGFIVVFVSLVISITLHEAMHAFTGYWLGDDTAHSQGRITLNPLRHVDPFATLLLPLITLILFKVPLLAAKPVPFNPYRVRYGEYGAALVGLAGPLTNLLLAITGAGFMHLTQNVLSPSALDALLIFVQINVGVFVFNMIPLPPLDGSRLLYAFAPEGLQKVMAQMEQYGFFIVFALLLAIPAFSVLLVNLNQAVLGLLF